jgi:hypothetical protein
MMLPPPTTACVCAPARSRHCRRSVNSQLPRWQAGRYIPGAAPPPASVCCFVCACRFSSSSRRAASRLPRGRPSPHAPPPATRRCCSARVAGAARRAARRRAPRAETKTPSDTKGVASMRALRPTAAALAALLLLTVRRVRAAPVQREHAPRTAAPAGHIIRVLHPLASPLFPPAAYSERRCCDDLRQRAAAGACAMPSVQLLRRVLRCVPVPRCNAAASASPSVADSRHGLLASCSRPNGLQRRLLPLPGLPDALHGACPRGAACATPRTLCVACCLRKRWHLCASGC